MLALVIQPSLLLKELYLSLYLYVEFFSDFGEGLRHIRRLKLGKEPFIKCFLFSLRLDDEFLDFFQDSLATRLVNVLEKVLVDVVVLSILVKLDPEIFKLTL